MCIKPICTNLDHLEVFSWNRMGIGNVPEGFLCYFNEGPSPTVYLSILSLPLVVLNDSHALKSFRTTWMLRLTDCNHVQAYNKPAMMVLA